MIDLATWKRRVYFEHYMHTVRCTYSVTLNIEVDELIKKIKSLGIKAYPVQIYMLSTIVNTFPEFRMAINRQGVLGCWDTVNPSYTIFNKTAETFSSLYTPFNHDFVPFYENCIKNIEVYSNSETLFPQSDMPENLFTISSLPWLSFSGFNLNISGEGTYLPPIFTIGRYLEQNDKKQMPLAIQVHHAVCDGYHVSRFAEALQDMAMDFDNWL
nr:CAT [uncultured bacterium]